MVKTKKRKWSYLGMLGISIVVFVVGWRLGVIHLDSPATGTEAGFRDAFRELAGLEWVKEVLGLPDPTPESLLADSIQTAEGQSKEDEIEQNETEDKLGAENNETDMPQNMTEELSTADSHKEDEDTESLTTEPFVADSTYFDDALFIGDSRTVGLAEYGNMGQAEFIADSGMSVYKIMETIFHTRSGEKMTLEQLLSGKQFGKIYIMLGINELGYDFDQTVDRYKEVVDVIRNMQPEAIIYLEANLHITKEKSESSPYYNNANINRFNKAVEEMADGETIFYLDVNQLFDDGEGNLAVEYTSDHTHILGKHYITWGEWILSQAIPVKKPGGTEG